VVIFRSDKGSASKRVWETRAYGLSFESVYFYADRFETFLHNLLSIAWLEMYRLFSFACWDISLPE
jgi:hypothetical protein